jgi:hypothetical protein
MVAVPLLFSGLGFSFLDPDEGLYAVVSHSMLVSGNWVVPRFNGLPYLEEPPLYFWLGALKLGLHGPAECANAVVYQRARPVFADIDRATLTIAAVAVEAAATERTRVVIPADFAGLPCDYDTLVPLARRRGWCLIADAAHSLGAFYGDRGVGTLTDMTTFSFHPAKLITAGEGGAVTTDRADLAERLREMRHHGIRYADAHRPWRYELREPGVNVQAVTDTVGRSEGADVPCNDASHAAVM